MKQRKINPWGWQDQFGFSQAIEIVDGKRVLFCAGQASIDEQGRAVHEGDMGAQIEQSFQNLENVLQAADLTLGNVVRLNFYTTDVQSLLGAYETVTSRLSKAGCQPASTLLGISSLAFPELLIEIEATAIQ